MIAKWITIIVVFAIACCARISEISRIKNQREYGGSGLRYIELSSLLDLPLVFVPRSKISRIPGIGRVMIANGRIIVALGLIYYLGIS